MASLGQDLKREREIRGISLRQISDSTRIGLRYLEALEADRWELIPRQFFLRAILRSYAKAVGLDENQVLKRYADVIEFGEQLEYRESTAETPPPPSKGRSWLAALIAALVIAAGGLLYIFVLAPRRTAAPAAQTPPPAAAVEVVPAPAAPAPSLPEELLNQQVSGLTLEASFSDETWLRVYADGRLVWDGTKRAGETLVVKAERELVLNSGNAGAMTLTLNGRKARPLGPVGAVMKDIRMTLENYTSFLLPREGD